jgi:hypothetical protein
MPKIKLDELCPCGSGKQYGQCHVTKRRDDQVVITSHQRLPVVPEPEPNTATVFEQIGEGTILFCGTCSTLSQDCGSCGAPLIVGLERDQVKAIIIKCKNCGSFNQT